MWLASARRWAHWSEGERECPALDLSRGADASAYVTTAKGVADNFQLDLLEFVSAGGSIISSAQWPARFGYQEEDVAPDLPSQGRVLRLVPLPDGATLGLMAAGVPIVPAEQRLLDAGWTQQSSTLLIGSTTNHVPRQAPFVAKNFRLYFRNGWRRKIMGTKVVAPYAVTASSGTTMTTAKNAT